MSIDIGLDNAVAGVYDGPLEEFVRRRDALARELRSAGQRDAAATIKELRKPSRPAWALNRAARLHADALEPLIAAVAETIDAQAADGDVRAAISRLRSAVREFAALGAHAAEDAGNPVAAGVLNNALLAVLSTPDSFSQLCAARLADVPEAGGLDFMVALPAPPPSPRSTPKLVQTVAASTVSPPPGDVEAAQHAAAVQQAATALADARIRSDAAQQSLRDAETKARATAQQLAEAQEAVRAAQEALDVARRHVQETAETVLGAEKKVTSLQ